MAITINEATNDHVQSSDVLKQMLTRSSDNDIDNLKVWVYVLTGVFSLVAVVLLGCIIALFVLTSKLFSKLKKLKKERRDDYGLQDYKIRYDLFERRPRINNSNNYQRFTLPSKLENDTNSDVFFGSGTSNSNSGQSRNPLSQPPGLNRQKSFSYEDENVNKNRPATNPSQFHQNPTSDYYNISDRSKFTY